MIYWLYASHKLSVTVPVVILSCPECSCQNYNTPDEGEHRLVLLACVVGSLEEEDDDGRNADSERTLVISNCLCYPDRHTNSGEEAGMRAERNLNTSRSVFNFLQDF
nr:uncharacterized protein LOC128692960 isoform X2 [Cherax quadricarinatus]